MKKIITAAVVIIILAIFGIAYFFLSQNRSKTPSQSSDTFSSDQPKSNEPKSSGEESNGPYVGENFTIVSPSGWIQSHMPSTLVSFHNPEENHPEGSAAAKINFKSYMAVSFDNAQEKKIDEIAKMVKQQIQGVAPSVSFNSETDGIIDGRPAKFLEADLSQQDVNFKVLMAIVMKDDQYFTLSANTTSDKWTEYRDTFYASIHSFQFK